MSHTPAPWQVMNDKDNAYDIHSEDGTHVVCFGHDYDDYGSIGARWSGSPDDFNQEREANARLIAAAPELLAAVHEMLSFLEGEYPDSSRRAGNWPTIDPLIKGWRAVLAKAEGREP